MLGVFLIVGYQLQTWGLEWTSPSRSAFLTGLCVIMVPFLSVVAVQARAGRAGGGRRRDRGARPLLSDRPGSRRGHCAGRLLTGACAIAFAFHIALTERYAARHPAFALVAAQLVLCAVVFNAVAPFGERRVDATPACESRSP